MYSKLDLARNARIFEHYNQSEMASRDSDNALRKATQNVVDKMFVSILERIMDAINYDPGNTETTVINPHEGAVLHGHGIDFIMHGLAKEHGFTRRPHHLAGILHTPVEQVQDRLQKQLGNVTVEDISDSTKSRKIVLKIYFPKPSVGFSPVFLSMIDER